MRVLYVLLLVSGPMAFGQPPKPLHYSAEVGSYFSTSGLTPFWQRANQFGIVPREPALTTLRLGLRVDYHAPPRTRLDSLKTADRRVDWGYAVEGVLNAGYDYKVLVPVAHAKVRLGAWEIWAGRRREWVGLADSTLSSGSFAWSGNALPMLKIQVAVNDYWPRQSLLGVKGFYAHGWFEEQRFVNHSFLHQKALYIRLGKANGKLTLYGGINHQAQWGGTNQNLGTGLVQKAQLPVTLRDYVDVVLGTTLGNQTTVDTTRLSRFDRENRIGNHLGTVDLGVEYRGRSLGIFLYRQSIYDDGSLFYLTNIRDGLHGLRIQNQRPANPFGWSFRTLLVEQLYTLSQGGAEFGQGGKQRGRDNYFNHAQFRDGWSRYGLTIGTPFITPTAEGRADLPPYHFTNNNRVLVHHIGLAATWRETVTVRTKLAYSQNYGTYEVPFAQRVSQFSGLLSVSGPLDVLGGVTATASAAADLGNLFNQSVGFYIGFRKSG